MPGLKLIRVSKSGAKFPEDDITRHELVQVAEIIPPWYILWIKVDVFAEKLARKG